MYLPRRFVSLFCIFFGLIAPVVSAGTWVVKPDRATGVYRAGDTVHWTLTWQGEGAPPSTVHYVAKRGGAIEVASGELTVDPTTGTAQVATKLAEPDTWLLEASWGDGTAAQKAVGGAVASPERILPAAPAPGDFDTFWAAKIAELAGVPAHPQLTPGEAGREGVEYAQITMDNIRGTHIHGQIARPAAAAGADQKLPALLIVQWAGVYGLDKSWVVDRAAEGWLALNILPHDLPIDQPPEFYAAQREGPLKDYWAIGNDDRETSYFLRMYLSCYRAVEYLKSRPDWDGRTLVVTGDSQGGQQTLVTAGLHPDGITAALALVPSGCDMLAPEAGRATAFPHWYREIGDKDPAAVRATSRYFDAANFAARIRAPLLIGVGLRDTTCPPATVFAAANQVTSYKELIILPDSGHQDEHGTQQPYQTRKYAGWLPALRAGLAPPVGLTAEQDHQHLMDVLGLTALRPGANPNDPNAPNAVNTDEAKANPYPNLPDALVTDAGAPVRSAVDWWTVRRPELVEHFEREVYGRIPADVPGVRWEVVATKAETIGGVPVVTQQLAGHVDNSGYSFLDVTIDLTLSTPADAAGPVPVMLHFGWPPAILALFPQPPGPTWEEQVLQHGWGVATIVPTSYQADNGAGLTQGIIGLANHGQPRTPEQWGALRAWAWGASRALDYFETDAAVDAHQVGIEGLSRYGKAALVTVAFDPRFAIGFIGSSGAGGARLNRRRYGELLENLASSYEYHWMAGNYIKYAADPLTPDDMPVDAHELIGLCAPRPVFISGGAGDVEGHWIDQRGMFITAVAAAPVYELLDQRGLGTSEFPALGTALVDGEIAWRQHFGGHTTLPNWPTFLAWADRYLHAPSASHWVASWTTAPQLTEERNEPPAPQFDHATVRQKFRLSIGGDALRVRFSNAYGDAPLTIDAAAIAVSTGGSAIDPTTSRPLTFAGHSSITLQPGALWLSDLVDFAPAPLADLAVTIQTTSAPNGLNGHPGSRTTSYFNYDGAALAAPALTGATEVDHWYFLTGVDVLSAAPDTAAIAILGDSITDGRGSTTNGNDRWPDVLPRRLRANSDGATANVAVLNQGIGGNTVLVGGLGPNLLARFDRDVVAQPGVKWLVVLEGINDLGGGQSSAAELIAAFDQVITRAHDHGLKVYGGTIMPYEPCFYWSPAGEAKRAAINDWIRHSGRYDAVIDFDAMTRDPAHPTQLRAELDSGDHLHLSAAGLATIAEGIDLSLFTP